MCQFFFFFLVHSSFCIFNHNRNQNANKYSLCAFFFLGFLILSHFLILCPSYFSSHPHVSLSVKMACHTTIICSTSKYQPLNSLLLKKKNAKRGFMPIVGPIPVIVIDAGQSCRCPSPGHSSQCRPESLHFKFRS